MVLIYTILYAQTMLIACFSRIKSSMSKSDHSVTYIHVKILRHKFFPVTPSKIVADILCIHVQTDLDNK